MDYVFAPQPKRCLTPFGVSMATAIVFCLLVLMPICSGQLYNPFNTIFKLDDRKGSVQDGDDEPKSAPLASTSGLPLGALRFMQSVMNQSRGIAAPPDEPIKSSATGIVPGGPIPDKLLPLSIGVPPGGETKNNIGQPPLSVLPHRYQNIVMETAKETDGGDSGGENMMKLKMLLRPQTAGKKRGNLEGLFDEDAANKVEAHSSSLTKSTNKLKGRSHDNRRGILHEHPQTFSRHHNGKHHRSQKRKDKKKYLSRNIKTSGKNAISEKETDVLIHRNTTHQKALNLFVKRRKRLKSKNSAHHFHEKPPSNVKKHNRKNEDLGNPFRGDSTKFRFVNRRKNYQKSAESKMLFPGLFSSGHAENSYHPVDNTIVRVRREAAIVDGISLVDFPNNRRQPHSFYRFSSDGSADSSNRGGTGEADVPQDSKVESEDSQQTRDTISQSGADDTEPAEKNLEELPHESTKAEGLVDVRNSGDSSNERAQELPLENITNTNNGSAPRHLYRSPMLVDYATQLRKKKAEEEEEAEAEADGQDQEKAPVWLKATGDSLVDLDLEAKDQDAAEDSDHEPTPEPAPAAEPEPEPEEDLNPETEVDAENEPHSEEELVPRTEAEAETEAETEAEAEPEGEPESEAGIAEGETKNGERSRAEEENETEPRSEGEEYSYAEPQPDWIEAKKIWGPCWEIHVYGIGLAFAILTVYSFTSVIRLWRKKNLLSQGYFIALNSIMFAVGFFRALYFLVDGYNSNGTFHPVGHYLLYSIGFPCVTSAFSILLLALLQTLKMHVISPKIQKTKVLVCIIIGHLAFSILTDIIVGNFYTAEMMIFVCQVATVIWGLMLFVGYIYVFRKLYKAAMWRQNEMMRISLAKIKLDGVSPYTKPPKLTLNVAIKITLSTAIFGLLLAFLQIYGMVGVFSVFSDSVPNPWVWLAFNTSIRLTELSMCITMSYVATQPFRYNEDNKNEKRSRRWSGILYMAPCRRIFECDSASLHDDDLSWADLPDHVNENEVDPHGTLDISEEATPMTANGRAVQAAAAAAVAGQNEKDSGSKKSASLAARPASLLVSENGFIRFREDGEMGGSPVLLSTDDELDMVNSESSMMRNPFYRDLIRRQEKERAVGRATYVNTDGITLQGEFGQIESNTDPELIPPPRLTYPLRGHSFMGYSYPNTGTNTPGTPRSFCSTDLDYATSEISYRPPSSIHLRDSIENALNIPGFTLRTPDILDSPLNAAYLRTRRGSLLNRGSRPTGSMSDLESLRHYGVGSRYGDSQDTVDSPSERAASPDSMYSYTLSNLTRAPLVRSYSDSIGKVSQPEASIPNSPERQYMKSRMRANMLSSHPENKNQFQTLLRNINDMCNAYNKLSPDDREADE